MHRRGEHDPGTLRVHEWGTFTSIAGADGRAVGWTPLAAPTTCRASWIASGSARSGACGHGPDGNAVLYFYSANDVTVDVKIRFHQGVITEWVPAGNGQTVEAPRNTG